MTSGWTSYGHPLDRRPEHYVGSLSQDEERPPEGEQLAEAKSAPGKVGWINVYQRANGDQLVGGGCWVSRESAIRAAGRSSLPTAFRLKVTARTG